jgi:hypothetical protein
MATDSYRPSVCVWEGQITTFSQPGSFPETRTCRIVELGHMPSMRATYAVEVFAQDALGQPSWRQSADPNVLREAFTTWVNVLRQ